MDKCPKCWGPLRVSKTPEGFLRLYGTVCDFCDRKRPNLWTRLYRAVYNIPTVDYDAVTRAPEVGNLKLCTRSHCKCWAQHKQEELISNLNYVLRQQHWWGVY